MAGEAGSADASWAALRDEAVAQLDDLLAVTADALEDLQSFAAAVVVLRGHLSEGGRATQPPPTLDIKGIRTSFTDRLEQLERTRSVSRIALWRVQLAEGWTMADIARAVGLLAPARVALTRLRFQR